MSRCRPSNHYFVVSLLRRQVWFFHPARNLAVIVEKLGKILGQNRLENEHLTRYPDGFGILQPQQVIYRYQINYAAIESSLPYLPTQHGAKLVASSESLLPVLSFKLCFGLK